MEVNFLASIGARTGLETPQIVGVWEFLSDPTVPFWQGTEDDNPSCPLWQWDRMYVRRDMYRFPESITEGTSILDEVVSATPTTSFGDTTVEGMDEYYYSLYFKYAEATTASVLFEHEIKRIGAAFTACKPYDLIVTAPQFPTVEGTDGSANGTTHVLTSASSTFLTNGVQAGFIVYIEDYDSYARVEEVQSETELYLGTSFTLSDTGLTFAVISHHHRYLISGEDFNRYPCINRYDYVTKLVDQKLLFNDILDVNEHIVDIPFCGMVIPETGDPYGCISIVTEHRYIRLAYDPTDLLIEYTTDDIYVEWEFSDIATGHAIAGAFASSTLDSIYVLDAAHRKVCILDELTGVLSSTIDLTGIPDSIDSNGVSQLHGLAVVHAASDYILVGCRNWIVMFPYAATSVDPSNTELLLHTRRNLTRSFGAMNIVPDAPGSATEFIVVVPHDEDLVGYLLEECGFLWHEPATSDKYTIGLYHIHDGAPAGVVTDSSGNGNNGSVSGTLSVETGKFYQSLLSTATALGKVSIAAIAADFNGDEGAAGAWFAIETAADFDDTNERFLINLVSASDSIKVSFLSGNIRFAHSNSTLISVAHPSKDLDFHHYMIVWSKSGNYVRAYVDGVLVGSSSLPTSWVGALTTAEIGDGTLLAGKLCEVAVSKIARNIPWESASELPYLITDPNKMYAFSGRDYDAY